jgi:hypothetical protein
MLKHAFVSACLAAGFSVGKQTDPAQVSGLIAKLHPHVTEHPLVRLGSDGDGGYLVPDDLEGIGACFSPGVDNRASFESDLLKRGVPCFLADASVERAPIDHTMIHFTKKFLGVVNDTSTMTFDDWIDVSHPGSDDLILQMDVEGAEWSVLLNISTKNLRRFRIIAIELHDLERLMDKHAFQIINGVFNRLLEYFYVVHNHPNNFGRSVRYRSTVIPRVLEMTFLRRDRARSIQYASSFPHPLDRTNDVNGPNLILPSQWYRTTS